ncbi:MAG TPA: hypothetical protein VGF47_06825 [Solirubrobacteraceae bacterium]
MAVLVVGDPHVERLEYLGKLLVGRLLDGRAKVRHGVEHRHDFVGMMAGRALRRERVERVRGSGLLRAQLHDAFAGEGDDRMGRVVVLL